MSTSKLASFDLPGGVPAVEAELETDQFTDIEADLESDIESLIGDYSINAVSWPRCKVVKVERSSFVANLIYRSTTHNDPSLVPTVISKL